MLLPAQQKVEFLCIICCLYLKLYKSKTIKEKECLHSKNKEENILHHPNQCLSGLYLIGSYPRDFLIAPCYRPVLHELNFLSDVSENVILSLSFECTVPVRTLPPCGEWRSLLFNCTQTYNMLRTYWGGKWSIIIRSNPSLQSMAHDWLTLRCYCV